MMGLPYTNKTDTEIVLMPVKPGFMFDEQLPTPGLTRSKRESLEQVF